MIKFILNKRVITILIYDLSFEKLMNKLVLLKKKNLRNK